MDGWHKHHTTYLSVFNNNGIPCVCVRAIYIPAHVRAYDKICTVFLVFAKTFRWNPKSFGILHQWQRDHLSSFIWYDLDLDSKLMWFFIKKSRRIVWFVQNEQTNSHQNFEFSPRFQVEFRPKSNIERWWSKLNYSHGNRMEIPKFISNKIDSTPSSPLWFMFSCQSDPRPKCKGKNQFLFYFILLHFLLYSVEFVCVYVPLNSHIHFHVNDANLRTIWI